MASLDLEEQEQLDALRAWWKRYANLIVGGVSIVLLAFAAWNGWQWHRRSESVQASAIFTELQKAAGSGDLKKTQEAAGTILENYPGTTYAAMAALVSAKAHFEAKDLKTARVQLQWVVDNARDPEVQSLARLRLANVMLDEKAYEDALKVLSAPHGVGFDARFDELRGDVLSAKGAKAEARAAYQSALGKAPASDVAARELLQFKLDSLAGA